jgi:hypothetical protein
MAIQQISIGSERVLTGGSGIVITDGGAGSTATLDLGLLTEDWNAGLFDVQSQSVTVTDFIDIGESSIPGTPAANVMRLYAESIQGFPFLSFKDDGGQVRKLVRDSVILVYNDSGSTIAASRIVYASGSSSDVPTIALAKADSAATMPAIGVTIESIANNSFGRVMQVGLLENVNTLVYSPGDIFYVSAATAGVPTTTPPTYPNLRQEIGTVLADSATVGSIQIVARSVFNDALIDHTGLIGLGDDDHTQYALLLGRSGGQTLIGGTASGEDLLLQSTSHATRGSVIFGSAGTTIYDEVNDRIGVGTATPDFSLHVKGTGTDGLILERASAAQETQIKFQNESGADKWSIHLDGASPEDLFISADANTQDLILQRTQAGVNKGNVGIQNASPAEVLDVTGSVAVSGTLKIPAIDGDSGNLSITANATGQVTFNDAAEDVNVVMESVNEDDMFFLDASADAIGINTNAPTAWLDIRGGSASDKPIFQVRGTRTTGDQRAVFIDPIMESDTNFRYTIDFQPQAKGNAQIGAMNMAPFIWPDNGTGPHTNCYGLNQDMRFKGTASISNAWGNFVRYKHESDRIATTTNGIAYGIAAPNFSGSTVPTNMHGIRIENQGSAGQTNCYGIRIFAQSGATNNYNIYSAGASALNWFEGDVEINGDLDHDGSNIGFYGTAPAAQSAAYTRNATVVESRTLLASASATTTNNNNVLAALIADLQNIGILG